MNRRFVGTLLALALVTPSLAFAQYGDDDLDLTSPRSGGGGPWSVIAGRTLGAGRTGFITEFGYPGISFGLLSGSSDTFDAGGKFSFNYGSPFGVGVSPSVALQGVLRFEFSDQDRFSFGLKLEPGVGFDFAGALWIPVPILLEFGIHPAEMVSVVVGLDLMPSFGIFFAGAFVFVLPILMGPGVEFKVQDNLAIFINTRFGPGIGIGPGGAGVGFAFKANMGLAFLF